MFINIVFKLRDMDDHYAAKFMKHNNSVQKHTRILRNKRIARNIYTDQKHLLRNFTYTSRWLNHADFKNELEIWLQPCINCPNNMSSNIWVTKNFIAYAKKQVQTQRLIVDSVITSWQEKLHQCSIKSIKIVFEIQAVTLDSIFRNS